MVDQDINKLLDEIKPSAEQLEQLDKDVGVVTFLTSENEMGELFHYYVAIYPSKIEEFLKVAEHGNYNIDDYGEVILSGPGVRPLEVEILYMKEKYGVVADPDADLFAEIQKAAAKYQEESKEDKLRSKYAISKKTD